MFPAIVFFGKEIWLYQIMALLGIFAAGIYSCRVCKKNGRNDNDAIVLLLFTSIGVFVGGNLLYGIVNYRLLLFYLDNISLFTSFGDVFYALTDVFGGSVFYGGLLGGLLAAAIYLHKMPERKYLVDIVSPAIPLFHFFGRIGCFLGGCCFGIESHFGFTYHNSPIEEANGVSRFPVQLLEALFNIALFFCLDYLRRKEHFKNRLLYVYLALYSTGRFCMEFLRDDGYRGFLFALSTSQFISILIFVCTLPIALGLLPRKQISK